MTREKQPDPEPDDLAELLAVVGWSGRRLSREMDVSEGTVYKWLKKETRTPGSVIRHLRLIIALRQMMRLVNEFLEGKP